MPRFAATMLGLTLVACSIGLNVVRYPVVWEMVGCTAIGGQSTPTVAAALPAQSDPAAPDAKSLSADAPPLKPIAQAPTPDKQPAVETDAAADRQLDSPKPLAPVTKIVSAAGMASDRLGAAGICRLPPVDKTSRNVVAGGDQRFAAGSAVVYPTTGIE